MVMDVILRSLLLSEFFKWIGPKDIAHKGITRSRIYLEKVVGLDFPDQHSSWNRINDFADLRNCIVHAAGRIGDNAERIRKLVRTSWFAYSSSETIDMDHEFLMQSFDVVSEFWNLLGRVVRAKESERVRPNEATRAANEQQLDSRVE